MEESPKKKKSPKKDKQEVVVEDAVPKMAYVSPIASPLLEDKALEYSLGLIRTAVEAEKAIRSLKKDSPAVKSLGTVARKCVKRGVQEVTKSLRKGEKGIVFLASDVYPVDIAAHLPLICEESNTMYAYVGSKKTVGTACSSTRPSSVLLINQPTELHKQALAQYSAKEPVEGGEPPKKKKKVERAGGEEEEDSNLFGTYDKYYKKAGKSIKKIHPYF